MKILQQYINSKSGDLSTCEDGFYEDENFVMLTDGATAKGKLRWFEGAHKGGWVAKETHIKTMQTLDKNISAIEAIKAFTQGVKKYYLNHELGFEHFEKTPEDRMEASILVYSKARSEVWAYGDCQLLINGKIHPLDKKIDELNSNMRSLYNITMLEAGHTLEDLAKNDLGRELIIPILKTQPLLANKDGDYGYPVLNGINYNENLLKIHKVKPGDEIVFASDGYPFIKNTLEESEKELAKVLKEDPFLIYNYKSTKGLMEGNISYDDRSYLKFIAE